jgi:hypothetical protein
MHPVLTLPSSFAGYRPLETIVSADDFDTGMNGWLDLRPNFTGPDFTAHAHEIDLEHWGPSMLSSATFPYAGTHGSASGTYSLKLSNRSPAAPAVEPPASGSMGLAIKRLSVPQGTALLRVEARVAYTSVHDRPGLGIDAMRAFGMFIDLQDPQHRYMPGLRYVNAIDGRPVRAWQYYSESDVDDASWSYGSDGWHKTGIDPQWFGRRYPDGSTDATTWFDNAGQQLIYNETDDKINWTRIALTVDLRTRSYVQFSALDREFHFPAGARPTMGPVYENIGGLLNPVFFVEADTDQPVNLFIDSVVVSAGQVPG